MSDVTASGSASGRVCRVEESLLCSTAYECVYSHTLHT